MKLTFARSGSYCSGLWCLRPIFSHRAVTGLRFIDRGFRIVVQRRKQ